MTDVIQVPVHFSSSSCSVGSKKRKLDEEAKPAAKRLKEDSSDGDVSSRSSPALDATKAPSSCNGKPESGSQLQAERLDITDNKNKSRCNSPASPMKAGKLERSNGVTKVKDVFSLKACSPGSPAKRTKKLEKVKDKVMKVKRDGSKRSEDEEDPADLDEDKRNIQEAERALRSLSGEWEGQGPLFSYEQDAQTFDMLDNEEKGRESEKERTEGESVKESSSEKDNSPVSQEVPDTDIDKGNSVTKVSEDVSDKQDSDNEKENKEVKDSEEPEDEEVKEADDSNPASPESKSGSNSYSGSPKNELFMSPQSANDDVELLMKIEQQCASIQSLAESQAESPVQRCSTPLTPLLVQPAHAQSPKPEATQQPCDGMKTPPEAQSPPQLQVHIPHEEAAHEPPQSPCRPAQVKWEHADPPAALPPSQPHHTQAGIHTPSTTHGLHVHTSGLYSHPTPATTTSAMDIPMSGGNSIKEEAISQEMEEAAYSVLAEWSSSDQKEAEAAKTLASMTSLSAGHMHDPSNTDMMLDDHNRHSPLSSRSNSPSFMSSMAKFSPTAQDHFRKGVCSELIGPWEMWH